MNTVILHNRTLDMDVAVNLMDDDLREELHSALSPCTNQVFMDAYVIAHKEKFHEEFIVN